MSEPTFYLAGPVMSVDDGGAGWRDEVTDLFDGEYEFLNPLGKYNVPAENLKVVDGTSGEADNVVGVDEIVEEDKRLLRHSDGILVGYSAVRSIGTPMEVMWARERDLPVAIWIRDGTDMDDLSPWYRHHATAMTNSVELALNHLERQAGGGGDE